MPRRAALLVVVAVLAAHWTAFGAGYVQDDHPLVETNPLVLRGDLGRILAAAYWEEAHPVEDRSLWRPVPILSYALERSLLGRASAPLSHAVNVALHALASLLLLAVALEHRAAPRGGAIGALAFGLHPAKSEAVFGVVGRAEILAAAFGLLALLLAARSRRGEGARARLAAWGSAAALFVALASKETAAVFVPLLLAQDLVLARGEEPASRAPLLRRAGALAPALVAIALFLVARTAALEAWFAPQPIQPIDNALVARPSSERVPTALALVAHAAALAAVPTGLTLDYSGASVPLEASLGAPRPLAGAAVLACLAALAACGTLRPRGKGGLLAVGALTTLLPFFVTGNFFFPVGAIFAERFLYLPAAGLGLLLAALPARRSVAIAAAVGLSLWGGLTLDRGRDWKDDRTAFEEALGANPRSPRAHFAVAKLDADAIAAPPSAAAEVAGAIALFDRAIALWDDYPEAWKEKGVLLARAGRLDEAEPVLRGALLRGPDSLNARFNHALVLQRLGRAGEAERALRQALLRDPSHAPSWASLGHLAFETGRYGDAARAYARAVALGRSDLAPRLDEARRLGG
jgi:tetratricopeptide (TPR) repeat protein